MFDNRVSETRLYFGNVPFDKTEEDVKIIFKDCGPIVDVKIIKRDGRSQGFGFITFASMEAVQSAILKNGTMVEGRQLKVNKPTKRETTGGPNTGASSGDRTNRLFVKNLPKDATDEQVRSAFAAYGTVTAFKCIRDHATGVSRGFGFVDFETFEQAEKALEADGKPSMHLNGNTLMVKIARAKESGSKFQMGNRYNPYGQMGGPYQNQGMVQWNQYQFMQGQAFDANAAAYYQQQGAYQQPVYQQGAYQQPQQQTAYSQPAQGGYNYGQAGQQQAYGQQ